MVRDTNYSLFEHGAPGIFLDIGANHGSYTKLFAKKASLVYAFEPHPTNVEILRKNCMEFFDRVVIVNKAVGNIDGKIYLYECKNPGGHSISEVVGTSKEWGHNGGEKRIEVDCIRLDSLKLSKVTAAKIDVEGAEQYVLEGGVETFTKNRMCISLETHQTINCEEIFKLLNDFGYRIYDREKQLVTMLAIDRQYFCQNYE